MVVALLVFYSWMSYLRFQNDEDFKNQIEYHYSMERISEINAALDSLKAGRPPENDFKGMPVYGDSATKERFLRAELKNNEESVNQNKAVATKKLGNEYKRIEAAGFYWLMPLFVTSGVALFYWGFSRWYIFVQKPSNERIRLELSIAEATFRKTEMEIKKLALDTKNTRKR